MASGRWDRSIARGLAIVLLGGCTGDLTPPDGGGSTTENGPTTSDLSTTSGAPPAGTGGSESESGEEETADEPGSESTSGGPEFEAVEDRYIVADDVDMLVVAAADGLLANDEPANVVDHSAASVAGGAVVVADDGSFTYAPPAPFWGEDTFEYAIQDGEGNSAIGTVRIVIKPTHPPLAEVALGNGGYEYIPAVGGLLPTPARGVGDINGDGYDEVVLGNRYPGSGRVFVVWGSAEVEPITQSSVSDGNGGFVIDGESDGDLAGYDVAAAGDVNGDGTMDIVIGAPEADPGTDNEGRAYVVFGRDDMDAVSLADVAAGEGGFIIDGAVVGDMAGRVVASAGDFNDDGLDDVLIGTTGGVEPSRTIVVFGKNDTNPVTVGEIVSGSSEGTAIVGAAGEVASAGDLNADGFADIVIGSGSAGATGRAYVVFGTDAMTAINVDDVANGEGGFVIEGEALGAVAGTAVAGGQDVNGDGTPDIVVGDSRADDDVGRVYIVFGKADTSSVSLDDVVAGEGGFFFGGGPIGTGPTYRQLGEAVALVGDLNGDGLADIVAGAPISSPLVDPAVAGRAFIVFGRAETDEVELEDIVAGEGGFGLDGRDYNARVGWFVGAGGDVNGDGFDDVLVSGTTASAFVFMGGNFTGDAW